MKCKDCDCIFPGPVLGKCKNCASRNLITATIALCSQCQSTNVICTSKYDTTGADFSYFTYRHECKNCGHTDETMTQCCYGYEDYDSCAFPHEFPESVEIIYEDFNRIILPSVEIWNDIIVSLSRNPEHLYSLPPRKFEELVAELLIRDGMNIHLTPASKDGGRDILAFSQTQAGLHLYLVECKRYSKKNPVDVSLVRALYGVVESERATAGLFVTTSYFTKGALSFRDAMKYRLSTKDFCDLVEWLKRASLLRS